KSDGVHLRLTARAADAAAARALLAPLEAAVRERLGDAIWGADADTLEDVVCNLLAQFDTHLAVAEIGGATGGQIARVLSSATAVDRVTAVLDVPSPEAHAVAQAGLDSGGTDPLSEEGVRAVAAAVALRWNTGGLLVTAGRLPAGRDDERVLGEMWVAWSCAAPGHVGTVKTLRLPVRAARGEVKRLMALQALNLLRKELAAIGVK
ncbi:MAG TPA: hypothetical protein VF276_17475, partial [Chloroflexia bacterium]